MKQIKFKHLEAIVFEPKWDFEKYKEKHPLKYNEIVYFLGEIPNVPGHCVVVKYSGEIVVMVHSEDFRKATEDEI